MANKVSIANRALIRNGSNTITSLTQNSEQARKINFIFNDVLDSLLVLHPWNFAMYRATLSQLSDVPIFEYGYQYQLPTDPYCLRVIGVYSGGPYKIEGRKLLTDDSTVNILYTKRVTDMNELSAYFTEAFSYYLSMELTDPETGSGRIKSDNITLYERAIKRAKLMDAKEGTANSQLNGSWIYNRNLGKLNSSNYANLYVNRSY